VRRSTHFIHEENIQPAFARDGLRRGERPTLERFTM